MPKRNPEWDREGMRKGYIKIYDLPENYVPGQELTDDMRSICGICGDFIDNGKEHGKNSCYLATTPVEKGQ